MITHANVLAMVFLVVLCSCAAHRQGSNEGVRTYPAQSAEYQLVITENWDEKRFEVHLNSKTDRLLCIHHHSWPNNFGQLHFSSHDVYVVVGDEHYPIADRNFGYCIADALGCYHSVPHGGAIYGFIAFSEFDERMYEQRDTARQLVFDVVPLVCE